MGMKFPKSSMTFIRTAKPLLKIIVIIITVLTLCSVIAQWGIGKYFSRAMDRQYVQFSQGIESETEYLRQQGDEIALLPTLHSLIRSKDSNGLIALIQRQRIARSVGLMAVVGENGVVLGRAISSTKRGDNVFLTTPTGRAVAERGSIQSFEMRNGFNQLSLNTARPVIDQGKK